MTSLYLNNLHEHLDLFTTLQSLDAVVIAAADTARFSLRKGCKLMFCGNGLLGRDDGKLRAMCDVSIIVSSTTTARIQEAHILIGHMLCGMIERTLDLVKVD